MKKKKKKKCVYAKFNFLIINYLRMLFLHISYKYQSFLASKEIEAYIFIPPPSCSEFPFKLIPEVPGLFDKFPKTIKNEEGFN